MDPLSLVATGTIATFLAYTIARKGLLSLGVAISLLVVYVIQVISALSIRGFPFVFAGPVTRELALVVMPDFLSAPWTWITFQFVHGSETHLLLNLLGLIFFSPVFEERVGRTAWAVLFFVGGAFGALAFVLLHLGGAILIGASAGVVSVFGGFGRLFPRDRVRLFLPLPGVPAIPVIYVVIGYLVLETFLSFAGPEGIAWEAHLAGIAFGFAVAPALRRLPGAGARRGRLTGLDGLRPLATTRELQGILAEAEKADLPEVRDAWIEKFVRAMRCPQCGGPVRLRFGRLTSECGWKVKIQ